MQLQAKGFPSTVKSSQAKPSHSDTYIKRPIHHETCLPQQTTSGPRVDHQFVASDSYAVCVLQGLKPAIISEAQAGHFFSVHPTVSLAVFILHLSEKFQCSHLILGRCIFLLLCSLASTEWIQLSISHLSRPMPAPLRGSSGQRHRHRGVTTNQWRICCTHIISSTNKHAD